MKFNRQTDFSLEELINLLKVKENGYPNCMLINEIGAIVCNGDDEEEKGEKLLLSLLGSEDIVERATSFFFLSASEEIATKHSSVLSEFRKKPENKEAVVDVDEKLEYA